MLKSQLDTRICDVEECENTQTYREYIRHSENELGMEEAPIDNMTDEELTEYLEFVDYLWEK